MALQRHVSLAEMFKQFPSSGVIFVVSKSTWAWAQALMASSMQPGGSKGIAPHQLLFDATHGDLKAMGPVSSSAAFVPMLAAPSLQGLKRNGSWLGESAAFSSVHPQSILQVRVTGQAVAQVVAFIKGTRTQPQCGFSHRVLTLLNESRLPYEVVNVLDDVYNPGVREEIKAFSQWPTIPQVRCSLRLSSA